MARNFVPYGQLQSGNYGVLLDPTTQQPLASAVEVLNALPSVASVDNFDGRLVFETGSSTLYVFATLPTPQWKPLEGIPATVGNVAGSPPVVPTPQAGELFWDLDTEVLFVWDGSAWQAAGGRYAAQVIENTYLANGLQATYPSGASVAIQVQYVEVFLDGVRQVAGTDYTIVGTVINFTVAPPNGLVIYVRALVSDSIVQNAQVSRASYVASAGQTVFDIGVAGVDPAGVFVFRNGLIQAGGGIDYLLQQQDTTISQLLKVGPTTARITTAVNHGIPVGASVRLEGFAEVEYNNLTYTVQAVPTATTFDITVLPTDPATGTGNPTMFFSPPYVNDEVVFNSGLNATDTVEIRTLKNVVVSGSVGEINTLASIGTGTPLDAAKVGDTLQIKSLAAGANVNIVDIGSSVEISANVGTGFEDRVGVNASSYTVVNTTSYVGVRNTSTPVTINLSGIAQNPVNSGRRITIKDESLGAGVNQIQIVGGASLIEGVATPYVINTNGGAVTLVMDGSDWFIVGQYP